MGNAEHENVDGEKNGLRNECGNVNGGPSGESLTCNVRTKKNMKSSLKKPSAKTSKNLQIKIKKKIKNKTNIEERVRPNIFTPTNLNDCRQLDHRKHSPVCVPGTDTADQDRTKMPEPLDHSGHRPRPPQDTADQAQADPEKSQASDDCKSWLGGWHWQCRLSLVWWDFMKKKLIRN
jgi:hypothetical protein